MYYNGKFIGSVEVEFTHLINIKNYLIVIIILIMNYVCIDKQNINS